jgi:mRNA interferase MazF
VLVVQDQALLDAGHPSTLIVPLTTNVIKNTEPLRIHVPASSGIKKSSDLLIDQIRAIDNRRFIKGPVGRLPAAIMKRVDDAICEVMGLQM